MRLSHQCRWYDHQRCVIRQRWSRELTYTTTSQTKHLRLTKRINNQSNFSLTSTHLYYGQITYLFHNTPLQSGTQLAELVTPRVLFSVFRNYDPQRAQNVQGRGRSGCSFQQQNKLRPTYVLGMTWVTSNIWSTIAVATKRAQGNASQSNSAAGRLPGYNHVTHTTNVSRLPWPQ